MVPALGSISFDSAVENTPARGAQDKAVTVQNPAGPAVGAGVVRARRLSFAVTYVVASIDDQSDAIHALQATILTYATERRTGTALAETVSCQAVRTLVGSAAGWLHTVQATLTEVPA